MSTHLRIILRQLTGSWGSFSSLLFPRGGGGGDGRGWIQTDDFVNPVVEGHTVDGTMNEVSVLYGRLWELYLVMSRDFFIKKYMKQ